MRSHKFIKAVKIVVSYICVTCTCVYLMQSVVYVHTNSVAWNQTAQ